jgi:hypothetical protein
MTRDRDIERTLETWLAPGPTGMPDHLFDSIVDRVERQPQARSARIRQRFHDMRPVFRIAAIAAVLVLTFGIGAAVVGGALDTDTPAPTADPSPAPSAAGSPTPSASPSFAAAALPADLAYTWIGAPRVLPSLGLAFDALPLLDLDPTDERGGSYAVVSIDFGTPFLASTPSSPGEGRLRLETAVADSACSDGQVGEYDYALAGEGMTLTLTLVDDPCATRADIVAGTWTRTDCRPDVAICLGDLPAGTWRSTTTDIRAATTAEIATRGTYGQVEFTVPAGWANAVDVPDAYDLVPSEVFATADADGATEVWHGIYIRSRVAAAAQDDNCESVEPGVGRSLEALTTWLVEHPGIVATEPVSTTVGGRRATMVDVRLDPTWTRSCPDVTDDLPLALLFRSESEATEPWSWGVGGFPDDRQRLFLVEMGPGNVLLIGIEDASSPSRFDALLEGAMPIVASFEFPE